MDIINRILSILSAKGLKQADLCNYIGIKYNVFTTWKTRGTEPPTKFIIQICDFLGVSVYYLLTGEEKSPSLPEDELELLKHYKKIPEKEKIKLISRAETIADIYKEQVKEQTDRKKLITVITTLKVYSMAAGAGVSTPFSEDDDYTIMQFPQFDVPTNATCGIYINGESMEPKYPDGCLVWVKETQDVNYGDVVIAIVNGEPFCKVYQPDGLYSINEEYSPILVTENDNFSMFGKVLGYYVE